MNILVTGGAGFIGSNIVDAYLNNGNKVIVVDNLYSGREKNINKNAIFLKMDIRDEKLSNIFLDYKIEFVNHQAAMGDVRGSIDRPREYASVNIEGGINLLECSVKNGIHGFIYSSTGGCVYGEPLVVPTAEEHQMQPRDPYGASKASFEIYLKMYHCLYGINYTIFRYPNVYGIRQNPFGEAGVVSIFAKRMLENKDVIINGDGLNERDFIFVNDVVVANLIATSKCANKVFNLGSGKGTNVNTVFNELKKIIGYDKKPVYSDAKIGEVRRSILSSELIRQELGWQPECLLTDGLQRTVDYIKTNEL